MKRVFTAIVLAVFCGLTVSAWAAEAPKAQETSAERWQRILDYQKLQFEQTSLLQKDLHAQDMSRLKEELASDKALTDDKRKEMLAFFDNQYNQWDEFRVKQYNDMTVQLKKIIGDSKMTDAQKDQAIQSELNKRKEERSAFLTKLQAANDAKRATFHSVK